MSYIEAIFSVRSKSVAIKLRAIIAGRLMVLMLKQELTRAVLFLSNNYLDTLRFRQTLEALGNIYVTKN